MFNIRLCWLRRKTLLVLQLLFFLLFALLSRVAEAFEIEIHASADELVLGDDSDVELMIRVQGEGAESVDGLQLDTSVGSISDPRSLTSTTWSATFHPPPQRHPQIACIIARTTGTAAPRFAGMTISLSGRTELSLRTDPGAEVTIDLGGQSFGPERAGANGLARVSVIVPPGSQTARVRSVDRLGNRNEREIALRLVDYPRRVLSLPQRVVVGSEAVIGAMALQPGGQQIETILLSSDRGTIEALGRTGGLSLFTYHAPNLVEDGEALLSIGAGEESVADEVGQLTLVPDEPALLRVESSRSTLIPGSDQRAEIIARVYDRFGNLRPNDRPQLMENDQIRETDDQAEGGSIALIPAPPTEVGVGAMVIEARYEDLSEQVAIRLVGGPATLARIEAPETAVADGRTAGQVRVMLVGETGLPSHEIPQLHATEGSLGPPRREEDGWWSFDFIPHRSSLRSPDRAVLEVRRGTASARANVRLIQPVPWLSFALFGGLRTNIGALVGPEGRAELSTRVALARGWIEVAVHTGIYYSRLNNELRRGTSTLSLFSIPLSGGVGYGFEVRRRVALSFVTRGGALLVSAREKTDFQPSTSRFFVAPLIEGAFEVTLGIGRGELAIFTGFSYASAPEGSGFRGNLLGLFAFLGYRLFII